MFKSKRIFQVMAMAILFFCISLFSTSNVVYAGGPDLGASGAGAGASADDNRKIPTITVNTDGTLQTDGILKETNKQNIWSRLMNEYRDIITGISGMALLTMIAIFIKNFVNLAMSDGNPSKKAAAQSALLISGVATLGLGAVTLFVSFFYNGIGAK